MGNGATLSDLQFILHLMLAVVLGGIIGLERQWRQRYAGLRTNILVSAGAALFIMLTDAAVMYGDATRIAAQIVSGIGFLGAGVIMKEGASIKGLNTAATIWCSAAVGSLAGLGLVNKAVMAAATILAVNVILRPIVQRINRRNMEPEEQNFQYSIEVVTRDSEEIHIRRLLLQMVSTNKLVLHALHSEQIAGSDDLKVRAEVETHLKNDASLEEIVSRLSSEKGVQAVTWRLKAEE